MSAYLMNQAPNWMYEPNISRLSVSERVSERACCAAVLTDLAIQANSASKSMDAGTPSGSPVPWSDIMSETTQRAHGKRLYRVVMLS